MQLARECVPRSPRKYPATREGGREGCCCSVQHMGEHAIARRVYALPAGGCTGSLVIHRRNVHPAAPAAAALTAAAPSLRDHPPLAWPVLPSCRWSAIRSNSTRGRIWYQTRHSWYFRKFDAHPMSRGRGMRGRIALRGDLRWSVGAAASSLVKPIVRMWRTTGWPIHS